MYSVSKLWESGGIQCTFPGTFQSLGLLLVVSLKLMCIDMIVHMQAKALLQLAMLEGGGEGITRPLYTTMKYM